MHGMTETSEIQLVDRCLEGEPDATVLFVRKFERLVYSIAIRMLGHHQDAEDVTQESLTRAIRHLGNWNPARPLKPWLLAIVVNRCKSRLSLKSRPRGSSLEEHSAQHLSVPATQTQSAIQAETALQIQVAMESLKTEYRQVFELFYKEERSVDEISQLLNVPEGTVKTWLHRGRKALATILKERQLISESSK